VLGVGSWVLGRIGVETLDRVMPQPVSPSPQHPAPGTHRPRVALVHDYLNQYGGAERVLEVFHGLFPDAPALCDRRTDVDAAV